jgi:hypothetical protein
MQEYALGKSKTARPEGSAQHSLPEAALPVRKMRSHPAWIRLPRLHMVQNPKSETPRTARETKRAGFTLSAVRRGSAQIAQTRTGTIVFLREDVSMFRMRTALSHFQVRKPSAARKAVVIAPSITGPSK